MRQIVLTTAAVELALLALGLLKLLFVKNNSDNAGRAMAQAYIVIGTLLSLLLLGPAFALAHHSTWLWFAMVLCVLAAVPVLVVIVGG